MIFFPSFFSLLASSNLGSKPSLINPPSLANIGGSSTRASDSKSKNLSCSGKIVDFSSMSFGKVKLESIFDIVEDCSNPFLIETRSLGPALSNEILDNALSKSGTFLSSDRRLDDKSASAIIASKNRSDALSSDEIIQLYNSGETLYAGDNYGDYTSEGSLQEYWTMDTEVSGENNGSGTTLFGEKNNNDGTFVNTPDWDDADFPGTVPTLSLIHI